MIVCKFGGTSVANADAIARTVGIVAGRRDRHPVVVVSALGGSTNALLGIAHAAAAGDLIAAVDDVRALRARHLETAAAVLRGQPTLDEIQHTINVAFDELAQLAEALSTLGFVTPRSLDAVAAIGERLSSQIVAAACTAHGLPAQWVDAEQVVITDDRFTRAEPRLPEIEINAQRHVAPVSARGVIPVLGGFVGSSVSGVTTTLGRGGSDFSAALLGAALRADAIEIWTDVDGMLTADPRIVPSAQLIDRILFDEASELAAFGAKVLHPSTIAPAVQAGIPVFVFNSMRPEGTGTMIDADAPRRAVRAIAGKRRTTLVRLRSAQMLLAHGFLRSVFDVFARHRTSVDVVTTSEVSISVTLDDTERLHVVTDELAALGEVTVQRDCGVVAIVGAGISDSAAPLATALSALGHCRVHMSSLSATGINLTLVIDDAEVVPAMQRLHAAFFEGDA